MSDCFVKLAVFDSLSKVFKTTPEPEKKITDFSMISNQQFHFQLGFHGTDKLWRPERLYIKVDSKLPIKLYAVKNIPVNHIEESEKYCHQEPSGLFPDILIPKDTNPEIIERCNPWTVGRFEKDDKSPLYAVTDSWNTLWITVNEDENPLDAGEYDIKFSAINLGNNTNYEVLGECSVKVKIIPALLPKQTTFCGNWFYCDCIADFYDVPIFSEKFYEIFRSFVALAPKNGMNMILVPTFTPPLDTTLGGERMTAQLVKINLDSGKYSFDFSMLKRYIDECKALGIEYFEHAHFFTQWGAVNAPKIYVTVDGEYKRLFGWDTDAAGEEYRAFLKSYIPAVLEFFKSEGLDKKVLFHISDEPNKFTFETYCAARESIGNLLDGQMVGDALCNYEYCEQGLIKLPIAETMTIEPFIGKCDTLWCYYTGAGIEKNISNRWATLYSRINRIIGVQMYYNNVTGIMHWGYNFYYDMLSGNLTNPFINPSPYLGRQPGTSYLVYPGLKGEAYPSIHQKVFGEAMQDIRLLQLLESLIGKDKTMSIIEKHFGKITFTTLIESDQQFKNFIKEVTETIEMHV